MRIVRFSQEIDDGGELFGCSEEKWIDVEMQLLSKKNISTMSTPVSQLPKDDGLSKATNDRSKASPSVNSFGSMSEDRFEMIQNKIEMKNEDNSVFRRMLSEKISHLSISVNKQ